MYHVSCVTCHVSPVTCHLSPVTCHLSHVEIFFKFFLTKKNIQKKCPKKIGQSGGASRWRVCYQQGLPCLVLKYVIEIFFLPKYLNIFKHFTCNEINTKRIYKCQKLNQCPGDWCRIVDVFWKRHKRKI